MARLQTAAGRSPGTPRSHANAACRRRVAALFAPSGEIPYRTLQGVADYARRHDWQGKRLLAETTMPIAEVARTAGFCDASRLGTVFRGLHGASPTAWRRSQTGASGRFRTEAT